MFVLGLMLGIMIGGIVGIIGMALLQVNKDKEE